MPRFLIIADDLSGAADCGIAFARSGLATVVLLSADADAARAVSADVVAVDANSRHLAPEAAAAAHLRLLPPHPHDDVLLYKKIDSTLRGNIGAELSAVVPFAGLAIVAPAFPDTGRVTRGGRVYVRDVPLEATELWQHEKRTGVADIAAILRRAGLHSTLAGLELVRGDPATLRASLEHAARDGTAAMVCDAETNDDLAAIAQASIRLSRPRFWVGSAGLARHLAPAAGIHAAAAPIPVRPRGPVLTVVGSLASIAREQAERLAATPDVVAVHVAAEALRQGESHPEFRSAATALETALHAGADVVLAIAGDRPVAQSEGPQLCAALGRLVRPAAYRLGSLVATGGDTARGVLTALGITGLRLAREIEPGVVLATAEAALRDAATSRNLLSAGLPIVTKAGAFGTPDSLVHCRAVLRGTSPHLES